jgi:hypothetical protein
VKREAEEDWGGKLGRAAGGGPDARSRRFPSPWTGEETEACFIVRDASEQALAFV